MWHGASPPPATWLTPLPCSPKPPSSAFAMKSSVSQLRLPTRPHPQSRTVTDGGPMAALGRGWSEPVGARLDQAARPAPLCRPWALASGTWAPDLRAVICPPNTVLPHLPLGLSQPSPAPPKQLSTPTSACTLGSLACHPRGLPVGRAGKAGQKGGGGAWEVLGAWGHLQKPRVPGQRLRGQQGACRGPSRGRLAQSGFVVRSSVSSSPGTVS